MGKGAYNCNPALGKKKLHSEFGVSLGYLKERHREGKGWGREAGRGRKWSLAKLGLMNELGI